MAGLEIVLKHSGGKACPSLDLGGAGLRRLSAGACAPIAFSAGSRAAGFGAPVLDIYAEPNEILRNSSERGQPHRYPQALPQMPWPWSVRPRVLGQSPMPTRGTPGTYVKMGALDVL